MTRKELRRRVNAYEELKAAAFIYAEELLEQEEQWAEFFSIFEGLDGKLHAHVYDSGCNNEVEFYLEDLVDDRTQTT